MCTVVLGDDIITRQGMLMMDDLKMQILEAIKECQIPKVNKNLYQVYIFSFLHLWKIKHHCLNRTTLNQSARRSKYSRTSMARTPLGL